MDLRPTDPLYIIEMSVYVRVLWGMGRWVFLEMKNYQKSYFCKERITDRPRMRKHAGELDVIVS